MLVLTRKRGARIIVCDKTNIKSPILHMKIGVHVLKEMLVHQKKVHLVIEPNQNCQ